MVVVVDWCTPMNASRFLSMCVTRHAISTCSSLRRCRDRYRNNKVPRRDSTQHRNTCCTSKPPPSPLASYPGSSRASRPPAGFAGSVSPGQRLQSPPKAQTLFCSGRRAPPLHSDKSVGVSPVEGVTPCWNSDRDRSYWDATGMRRPTAIY